MGIYHTDQESLKVYNTGGGGGGGDSTAANQSTEIDRLTTMRDDIVILKGYLDGVEGKLDSIIAGIITTVAHDAVATSVNPVLTGGYASDTVPTAVSTALDAVRTWLDLNGALMTASRPAGTATVSSLASAASSAQLLAFTSTRKGLILQNTDANDVYVKYGTTASATSFTVIVPGGNGYWEMPAPIYTGRIDAIWAADGTGSLYSTELT